MAAWHAVTDRYRDRDEGELAIDLDDETAARFVLVFTLVFDPRFDGSAVGLQAIPYDWDETNAESVFAARSTVYQAVSPPTGGAAWSRKLWMVLRYAERSLGITNSFKHDNAGSGAGPASINGEINGDVGRLLQVQRRVRILATERPWLADAIRAATLHGFPTLHAAYLAKVGGRRPPTRRPGDPPDPWSNDVAELREFGDDERSTIRLFRLGGLADLNLEDPIVPEPQDAGLAAAASWNERLPAMREDEGQGPDPAKFPSALAEAMLDSVERWVGLPSPPPVQAARGTDPKAATRPNPTRRERQLEWLAKAMLTVRDHPEWSDAKVAEQVGINKSTLSRSPEYHAAASMARAPKTPSGSVSVANGERNLEAVDDFFDPNRHASRQSQDEEDTDDRIDREMEETQRKTQRGAVNNPVNRRSSGA